MGQGVGRDKAGWVRGTVGDGETYPEKEENTAVSWMWLVEGCGLCYPQLPITPCLGRKTTHVVENNQ